MTDLQKRAAMARELKHYRRLKAIVESRIRGYLRPREQKQVSPLVQLPPDLAVAHTLADMRRICADLKLDYDIADRLGWVYYTAEVGGALR